MTNIVLHSLAKTCIITQLNAGERFMAEQGHLHLIAWGRLSKGEDEAAPVLGKGEFWGSDDLFSAISEKAKDRQSLSEPTHTYTAIDSSEICSVPLKLVSRIPVVRWKLFEAFRKAHAYAAPRFRGTAR